MSGPYVQTYDRLHVCALDASAHARTCGYWYTVTSQSSALTAFAKRESLSRWADERGLILPFDLPIAPVFGCGFIKGVFRVAMHLHDPAAFYRLDGLHTRTMSNGEYTLAIVTTDPDGLRTVHKLNPNVKDRPVFRYDESKELMG